MTDDGTLLQSERESDDPGPVDSADENSREGSGTSRISRNWWWGLVAAITLVQSWMRLWSVAGLDNFHDDLLISYRAWQRPLNMEFLLDEYAAHWGPLARLVEWAVVNAAPFDARFAYAAVIALGLFADVGMIFALREVFGRGVSALIIFACWAFTPVLVTTVGLWSLGLDLMLLVAGMAWALYFHVRAVRQPSRLRLVLSVAVYAALLLVDPQSVAYLPFLILTTIAYPGWGARGMTVRRAFREAAPLWGSYIALTLVYLIAYRANSPQRDGAPFSPATITDVLGQFVLGLAFPSVLGGPWASDPGSLPSAGALSGLTLSFVVQLVLLLVVASICIRHKAWRAWSVLGVLVLMHSFVIATTVRFDLIDGLLRQSRYLVPLLVPAYVLLGAAFSFGPTRDWWASRRRGPVRVSVALVGVVTLVLLLEGSWVTTYRTSQAMKQASTAAFWTNVRKDFAANPEAVIIDRDMPPDVLFGGFLPELGRASESLRFLVTDQTWTVPSADPFLITDDGRLAPARMEPFAFSLPGPSPNCGYVIADGQWVDIPMEKSLFNWGWGVRLNYLSATSTELEVDASGSRTILPIEEGVGNIIWVSPGVIDTVRVRLADNDGLPVCVDVITVGGLVPK